MVSNRKWAGLFNPAFVQKAEEKLQRSRENMQECWKFRRDVQGELYRIERKYNILAHSRRAAIAAILEAQQP